MRFLPHLLRRFVRNGRLTVIDHDGARESFGSGANGPDVTLRLHDATVEREIFFNPELKAAEAYMDGRLTVENGGRIHDLLELFSVNRRSLGAHPVQQALRRWWGATRRLQQRNPLGLAEKNVGSHYNIPTAFYRLWLDESMAYSCAYFARPDMTLEEAQRAKYRHIAAKLNLAPGMRVLDIGSGWGGLAIYLARHCGARVTGLNISADQCAAARETIAAAGLDDRIEFRDEDYRLHQGTYDRVVSVGMMEHVGVGEFHTYFRAVRRLCGADGFAMIHAIGRMSPPGTTAPFIRKYIFPGGYVPALSEVFASLERTGLWCADCEGLRLHYYWTIKHWRERYEARRAEALAMMGERFCRMWDFYLSSVELGFLHGSNFVFQLLLAERRDAVPVTLDYIAAEERRLEAAGG
jgi:cyclopropane-fatty-acyl-phospholipid synthase